MYCIPFSAAKVFFLPLPYVDQCVSSLQAKDASRLILHISNPSPLLPLLTSTSFSSSLCHVISHPPALLNHIAAEYLTVPSPNEEQDTDPKFWSVFIPIRDRSYESERLVFGPEGKGSGDDVAVVVELIIRGSAEGAGRRRGVQRSLSGWDLLNLCERRLDELGSLRTLWRKAPPTQV